MLQLTMMTTLYDNGGAALLDHESFHCSVAAPAQIYQLPLSPSIQFTHNSHTIPYNSYNMVRFCRGNYEYDCEISDQESQKLKCLTLFRALWSFLNGSGRHIVPALISKGLGGCGFKFLLQPHILPRLTQDSQLSVA